MAKDVGEKLAAHRLGGRPLYRWLSRHHDEIAAVFATQARPSWEALAATARADKVLDATGKPPTRHAVRKAWKTLKADMARTSPVVGRGDVITSTTRNERQPTALPTSPPPDTAPRERKPLVLRTARPLGPDELPQDDGSTLPKPFSRTKQ